MDGNTEAHVRSLLERIESGDSDAGQKLLAFLYTELHELAESYMRGQPRDHTLQATALVNEAYLKMGPIAGKQFKDRARFMGFAAKAMRSVLVDHARAKARRKRTPPGESSALDQVMLTYEENALDLVALDEALSRLQEFDEKMAQAVELRFFAGQSMEEIAKVLGISKRSLERDWSAARAWLLQEVASA